MPVGEGSAARPGLAGRIFDGVVSIFNAGGSLWIFVLMILLSADVLSRGLFAAPINGVPLLVELSILMIVFMQLAAAIRSGRLTRSEVLIAKLLEKRPSIGITLRMCYDGLGMTKLANDTRRVLQKNFSTDPVAQN